MGFADKLLDSLSFRGNIPGLFVSSVIEGTAWHMYELVWQPYMLSLGGTTPLIGVIISIWTAVTSILQLVTGELVDSWGRKKAIIAYYLLSVAGLTLAIVAENWIYFLVITVLYGFADALSMPSFNPIFSESVPPNRIGVAFSLLTLTWSLPGFYGKILGGYIGDRMGEIRVLYIILFLEIVSALWFYFTVEETLKDTKPLKWKAIINNIKSLTKPGNGLGIFFSVAIFDRFGWALNSGLVVALLTQTHGYSLTQIGILMTLEMGTLTLTVIPIGKLLDRYGPSWGIIASLFFAIICFFGFSITNNFYLFAVLQTIRGISLAFWDPGFNSYLSKSVKDSERGRYYGNINSIKGMISIPAPFIGAMLFNQFGFRGPFIASVAFCLIAFILSLKLLVPMK